VLFDPFEKEFDLPAALVELSNGEGGKDKVVGEKHQPAAILAVVEGNPPQRVGIELRRLGSPKKNDLVAAEPRRLVHGMGGSSSVIVMTLGPKNEESRILSKSIQTAEVDIASIENIQRPRLQDQLVEKGDVVDVARSDIDPARNIAAQVQERVELDRSFPFAELGPREKREAQIDGRRIEDVSGLFQSHSEVFVGVQFPGPADQNLGEVGIDAPISLLVGFGQGAAGDLAAEACVIEFGLHRPETGFDISKAFSVCELREGHAEKLFEAGKLADVIISSIPSNTLLEFVFGQVIHQLGKNDSSRIHRPLLSTE
jgi:hypothetical protein